MARRGALQACDSVGEQTTPGNDPAQRYDPVDCSVTLSRSPSRALRALDYAREATTL